MHFTYQIKAPSACSDDEIGEFVRLVEDGGEVVSGLKKRVKNAWRLGFALHASEIVGTVAIKKPVSTYQEKVFRKAGASEVSEKYEFELGWIYVRNDYRKKGIARGLVGHAMSAIPGGKIFATTRVDNSGMKTLLFEHGFIQTGRAYEGKSSKLELFCR